jgi:hypothetical protein
MTATVEPKELDRDDFLAFLEERVQEAFGMTLAEFTESLRRGELDPEKPQVASLAILVGARSS